MASATQIEIEAAERIKDMSRAVRSWFASDFFDSIEYENDVFAFVNTHPTLVSEDEDLTPLGREVYRQIKASEA